MSSTRELEKFDNEKVNVDDAAHALTKHVLETMFKSNNLYDISKATDSLNPSFLFNTKLSSTVQELDFKITLKERSSRADKITKDLQTSVDSVLPDTGLEVIYNGRNYLVTKTADSPSPTVTIAAANGGKTFKVKLVPTLHSHPTYVTEQFRQMMRMMESKRYTGPVNPNTGTGTGTVSYYYCVDEHGFEFDFGFSSSSSYNNIKRVIKLMMYLRNIKGLCFAKLPVSVMKVRPLFSCLFFTVVTAMTSSTHQIKDFSQASMKNLLLLTEESLWRNDGSLETCFIAALDNLLTGLKKNSICNPFYPEVCFEMKYALI